MENSAGNSESPLSDEVGFLAVRTGATATKLARERLRPLGLHVRSYSVLALAAGSGWTQREVAEYLDLDPSQVVSLVDELEKAGLVRREVAPGDRRSKLVRATSSGAALLRRARGITAVAEDETLRDLTVVERKTLLALLRRIGLPTTRDRNPLPTDTDVDDVQSQARGEN